MTAATNPIRTSVPVTIADRAGKSFPVHAHAQGYARYKSGSVSIEEESAGAIVAKVRGQQIRDVRLQEEGGRLLVHCTCPSRTFERPGCKHVWATLLEVDRRGALPGLRAARTPLAVAFLEPTPAGAAAEVPADQVKEKKKKKTKPKPKQVSAAPDRASRRSPRATAAPPEARETPQRSPRRSSGRRR